jgi:ubiquinone/menaquinone biosynthesis C-methylase UbiE
MTASTERRGITATTRGERIAKAYDAFFTMRTLTEHRVYYDFLAKLCEGRCLDVACANGGWLLARLPGSIGVDFSPVAIRQIEAKGLRGVVGDAHSLPFRSGAFDTVASLGSLEHFLAPDVAIAEMARVLKDQGSLVLTINAKAPLAYCVLEKALLLWYRLRHGRYVTQPIDSRLDSTRIARELLRNGLRIVFEGAYSREVLGFGRFQRLALRLLPFTWRSTECVHLFYCLKADLGKVAEYGPYFPRR